MNLRAPIAVATVLLVAAVCYIPLTIRPSSVTPPTSRSAVGDQAETTTTAVRFDRLKAHVRETIDRIEDIAEQWNERNARHLETSLLGRDIRQKIRAAMRKETDMIARWKTTLRQMTDGDYEYEQALMESEKMDAEEQKFMAESNAIVKDMQRIQGCHCGN